MPKPTNKDLDTLEVMTIEDSNFGTDTNSGNSISLITVDNLSSSHLGLTNTNVSVGDIISSSDFDHIHMSSQNLDNFVPFLRRFGDIQALEVVTGVHQSGHTTGERWHRIGQRKIVFNKKKLTDFQISLICELLATFNKCMTLIEDDKVGLKAVINRDKIDLEADFWWPESILKFGLLYQHIRLKIDYEYTISVGEAKRSSGGAVNRDIKEACENFQALKKFVDCRPSMSASRIATILIDNNYNEITKGRSHRTLRTHISKIRKYKKVG